MTKTALLIAVVNQTPIRIISSKVKRNISIKFNVYEIFFEDNNIFSILNTT